jgi:GNAT superfamily N-acetyltransferase
VRVVEVGEGKGALCSEILALLPDWFGMPEANAAFVRDVETLAMFAAQENGVAVGFLALKQHTPHAFEVHVMGVRPERHRQGAGRALVAAAAAYASARGARLLTVKTLSASHPDPGYAATRQFYEAVGFAPVEEFPTLWGAENPALMLVRIL